MKKYIMPIILKRIMHRTDERNDDRKSLISQSRLNHLEFVHATTKRNSISESVVANLNTETSQTIY